VEFNSLLNFYNSQTFQKDWQKAMDKLLKVHPEFADKEFIYQKESFQKKLKISDLDIDEYTLIN